MNRFARYDKDSEAFHGALRSLQEQAAARRCLQVVVKRANELSREAKAEFDSLVRSMDFPGHRPGKAPAAKVPYLAGKNPKLERRLCSAMLRYWVALHVGLPESVLAVAQVVAPDVDFEQGAWTEIASTVAAGSSRTPSSPAPTWSPP